MNIREQVIEQSRAETLLPLIHTRIVAVMIAVWRTLTVHNIEDAHLGLAINKQSCQQTVSFAEMTGENHIAVL